MDRFNIVIEVQHVGPKRANVRATMLVSNLIANAKDKFNLDGQYELWNKNTRQRLNPQYELAQAGVAESSVLVCAQVVEDTGTLNAIRRGAREGFSKRPRRVYLLEGTSRVEYDLLWHPAIIGRKDLANPSNNRLLAVDLEEIEESPSVSRHHACITEKNGSFSIESINDRNLTILNGTKIRPGKKHPLPPGATIQVGNLTLTFHVLS